MDPHDQLWLTLPAVPEEAPDVKSLRRSRSRFLRVFLQIIWARLGRLARFAPGLGYVGGAVKAGPLGPPAGGALTAPGWVVASHHGAQTALWAVLVALVLGTADLTMASFEAGRPKLGCRPFLRVWFAWCVPATARRAHSNTRPRPMLGGHGRDRARVLAVPELLKRPAPGSGFLRP